MKYILLLLSILILSCQSDDQIHPDDEPCHFYEIESGTIIDSNQYEILDLVFERHNYIGNPISKPVLAWDNHWVGLDYESEFHRWYAHDEIQIDSSLITNFISINEVKSSWNPKSTIASVIYQKEIECLVYDNDHDYSLFFNKYPESGGYFNVSKVSFNSEGTKAFVHYTFFCESLCGYGYVVFYQKIEGLWISTYEDLLFIS